MAPPNYYYTVKAGKRSVTTAFTEAGMRENMVTPARIFKLNAGEKYVPLNAGESTILGHLVTIGALVATQIGPN